MPYPTSLDSFTPNVDNVDIIYAADINELQDSIEALEAKVGVDSSAVTSSHDYKLGEVTSTDKAVGKTATHTLTNKTLTSPTITGATITTSTLNGVTLQTAGSATDFLAANGTYQTGAVANASTTVKGITELATSAEINAGTATGGTGAALVVTPDSLAASSPTFDGTNLTNIGRGLFKNGSTTYDLSTASGTQNIAHGLGITPKSVKLTVSWTSGNSAPITGVSFGSYDGTNMWNVRMTDAPNPNASSTTYVIRCDTNYTIGTYQTATVTVTSTNIVLSWTKVTGTPLGTATINWEVQA